MPAPNRLVRSSFRTVDLGQQYDTVSHVGGIVFSFNSTIHFWCITFGVIRYATLPSRPSYWTFTFGALHSP